MGQGGPPWCAVHVRGPSFWPAVGHLRAQRGPIAFISNSLEPWDMCGMWGLIPQNNLIWCHVSVRVVALLSGSGAPKLGFILK